MADDSAVWLLVGLLGGAIGGFAFGALVAMWFQPSAFGVAGQNVTVQRDELGRIVGMKV